MSERDRTIPTPHPKQEDKRPNPQRRPQDHHTRMIKNPTAYKTKRTLHNRPDAHRQHPKQHSKHH
eukprot:3371153-Prorocentrum_lima.AAC.1